ncbi:hypothetical protein [Thauera sp.]|uniref:hypothetical protein n=1 Tax=Thauera sp. TaxID=1905334 RepID=UPI001B72239F|nr:hypothetical protein [Thauera sp.]MBP6132707.1 hypothetical protein [Thauera sp.]
MKPAIARTNYLLLRDDGTVHYWFSKFLTDQFANPHTRELSGQSCRLLYRFLASAHIELALRATEGSCLSYDEAKALIALCWRPLPEIEAMGDRAMTRLTSATAGKAPAKLPNAVKPNTVHKRLHHIAQALEFYREVFIDPRIPFSAAREELRSAYGITCDQLRRAIRGTKQSHHLAIKSLPRDKYLAIIEAVFTRPDHLFQAATGRRCRTVLRDRAMTLLACEGLRPGALGNVALRDFQPHRNLLAITDNRAKRSGRVTANTPVLKLGDSVQVNSGSETIITLWPFTVRAIQEYIDTERDAVLRKRLTNRSDGFLFLSDQGEPLKHRSSITLMFNKLGDRLAELGLLDVTNDPYFMEQKRYHFYSYVLRHSAASFFLAEKCREIAVQHGFTMPSDFNDVPDRVKDLMKLRFGWTINSTMPEHYAKRALTDQANVTLMEFNQHLLDAVQARKQYRETGDGL